MKENKSQNIISNYMSLSFLQVVNYLLPLIAIPYLFRVVGVEKYGIISFAYAFAQFFIIIADYGFNYTAVRQVSIARDNKVNLEKIFNCVVTVKILFVVIGAIFYLIISQFIPGLRSETTVVIYSFGVVIGNALFPSFFFQGLERMGYVVVLSSIPKIIFTLLIFIIVKQPSDYIYVPGLISLGYFTGGLLAIYYAIKDFNIKMKIPLISEIKYQLSEGLYVFLSMLSTSLYTWSNIFLLGLLTNNTIVGYYAAAERIIRGVQGLLNQGANAIFPHISRLAKESHEESIIFIKKVLVLLGSGSLLISISIFLTADLVGPVFFGNEYAQSVIILKILSAVPFITQISNILGIQTMLAFDRKRAFFYTYLTAGIFNIIMALILIPIFQHKGIAVSMLMSELLVTVIMVLYLKHKGLKTLGKAYSENISNNNFY